MKILVENGSFHLFNMGDAAMLKVTLRRLHQRWPDSILQVPTHSPERLMRLYPAATPLVGWNPGSWHRLPTFPVPVRLVPPQLRRLKGLLDQEFDLRYPATAGLLKRLQGAVRTPKASYLSILRDVDAVVACGGGLINEWFPQNGRRILSVLRVAQSLGKPTAMFGLGLGPVVPPELRRLTRTTLNRLDVLALRERERGPALLRQLRVRREPLITGDDAIEMAYERSPSAAGRKIGFNIRIANHSDVPADVLPRLGAVLRQTAVRFEAELLPVPVFVHDPERSDLRCVPALFGEEPPDCMAAERIEQPEDLVAQIGTCGVVITGSYHAAVFAYAQGIPVISLAETDYYRSKHAGVAGMFECEPVILRFRDPELEDKLFSAVDRAMHMPQHAKVSLSFAAHRQVAESLGAYDAFFDVVERRVGVQQESKGRNEPMVRS